MIPTAVVAASGPKSLDQEALAFVRRLVPPGADHAALSQKLRPTPADYDAVFTPELARKLRAAYDPAWDQGQIVVRGKADQTAVLVWGASSQEIKAWSAAAAQHFPGGWKDVGPHLKPGIRVYAFKFVKPGETLGMAFDGLARIDGQWRIFPKPWRALRGL